MNLFIRVINMIPTKFNKIKISNISNYQVSIYPGNKTEYGGLCEGYINNNHIFILKSELMLKDDQLLYIRELNVIYPITFELTCALPVSNDYLLIQDQNKNQIYKEYGGRYNFTLQSGPSKLYISHCCVD